MTLRADGGITVTVEEARTLLGTHCSSNLGFQTTVSRVHSDVIHISRSL